MYGTMVDMILIADTLDFRRDLTGYSHIVIKAKRHNNAFKKEQWVEKSLSSHNHVLFIL